MLVAVFCFAAAVRPSFRSVIQGTSSSCMQTSMMEGCATLHRARLIEAHAGRCSAAPFGADSSNRRWTSEEVLLQRQCSMQRRSLDLWRSSSDCLVAALPTGACLGRCGWSALLRCPSAAVASPLSSFVHAAYKLLLDTSMFLQCV